MPLIPTGTSRGKRKYHRANVSLPARAQKFSITASSIEQSSRTRIAEEGYGADCQTM